MTMAYRAFAVVLIACIVQTISVCMANSNVVSENGLTHLRTICYNRSFGLSELKVEMCRTVWQNSNDNRLIETCKLGHIEQQVAEKLKEAFGGILKPRKMQASRRGPSSNHDGDMCCPTNRNVVQAPGQLENTFGEMRDIFHLGDHGLFQFYHTGNCIEAADQIHCSGHCVQEMTTVYLMVIRDDLPMGMSFEPFQVPSYCSCKNLGSSHARDNDSSRNPEAIPANATVSPTPSSVTPTPSTVTPTPTTVTPTSQQPTTAVTTTTVPRRPTAPTQTTLSARLISMKNLLRPTLVHPKYLNAENIPVRPIYSGRIPAHLLRKGRRPPMPVRTAAKGETRSDRRTGATTTTTTSMSTTTTTTTTTPEPSTTINFENLTFNLTTVTPENNATDLVL